MLKVIIVVIVLTILIAKFVYNLDDGQGYLGKSLGAFGAFVVSVIGISIVVAIVLTKLFL